MNNATKIIKTILFGTVVASFATATTCLCGTLDGTLTDSNSAAPPASSGDSVKNTVAQRIFLGSAPAQQSEGTTPGIQPVKSAAVDAASLPGQPGIVANSRSGGPSLTIAPPARPQGYEAAAVQKPSGKLRLDEVFAAARQQMVSDQLAAPSRGIANKAVLSAMGAVPRHQFVLSGLLAESYEDKTLEAGFNRTIESPYVVASVAEQLNIQPGLRVLELGTGVGYQTAVLSQLVKEIYSVEPQDELARGAIVNFERLGYTNNIFVRHGELAKGWPEAAPFDAVVVNGDSGQVSEIILSQLKEGGRLIIPVDQNGNLDVLQKNAGQLVALTSRHVRLPQVASNKVTLPIFQRIMIPQKQ
jgi:protein-L-isoaspartate(D-aspartate) O-methyltransferase